MNRRSTDAVSYTHLDVYKRQVQKAAFTAKDDTGIMVNSDFLNGLTVKDAIPVNTQSRSL